MPEYGIVQLGAFLFTGANGAAINGEIEIGALPRSVDVAWNALSEYPVQVADAVSGFRPVTLPVKLAGRETEGETAPEHLRRMRHNLKTEVEKDTNTLTIWLYGVTVPDVFTVYKNDDYPELITPLTQTRSVMQFRLTLNCLP